MHRFFVYINYESEDMFIRKLKVNPGDGSPGEAENHLSSIDNF